MDMIVHLRIFANAKVFETAHLWNDRRALQSLPEGQIDPPTAELVMLAVNQRFDTVVGHASRTAPHHHIAVYQRHLFWPVGPFLPAKEKNGR